MKKSIEIGGRELSFEIGKVAQQADAAVLARYGDTVVLATVVSGRKNEEIDYLPLFVEYVEKLYAGGRIKGSRWVKREGRPSDEAILNARLIDRCLRPLFPKTYRNEVQVIITILSIDKENDPDILGVLAASVALSLSQIPWNGPIAALRVGHVSENFLINPSNGEMQYSDLDLIVSATENKILMLEGGGNQIPEKEFAEAIKVGHEEIKKIIKLIGQLKKEAGKEKQKEEKLKDPLLVNRLRKEYSQEIKNLVLAKVNEEGDGENLTLLADEIVKRFQDNYTKREVLAAIDKLFQENIRENILKKDKRPDGRSSKDIREIKAESSILPRTHGSALFQRGNTQVLSVTTLASPSLEQWLESPAGEETKRYMHHYYMPPYSVGETGRLGWPSRREVGHGALAERALLPVIPSEEEFPYTIRVVSEIMSSNGSTSMASVCGSTLSLMDAGVPVKEAVAGLSIGLVTRHQTSEISNQYVLLSDIMGIEDFAGDMDFKVAGTKRGITSFQLDVKIPGLPLSIIEEALKQAREGRLFILEKMLAVLPAPRVEISKFAPRVKVIKIPVEKIGDVIGPGGKVIRQIIAETNCDLDLEDDGALTISGLDKNNVRRAISWVEGIIREVKEDEIFEGEVKRIVPFGAFVEIFPGKEGLVHVSQMSRGFVKEPESIVKIGQKVKVRVVEVDERDRINLSMLFGEDAKKRQARPTRPFGRRPPLGTRPFRRPSTSYQHPHLKPQYP